MKPFFISIPHAGETVPHEATWLKGLPETVLMCDVDRYVDRLYKPVIDDLQLPSVVTEWHRYVVDLNRLPDDIDAESVEGASNEGAKFLRRGVHWAETTKGAPLMARPISRELHRTLIAKYFEPFHARVREQYARFKSQGFAKVYQLDAHSCPSKGTAAHRDNGGERAQIIVSDCEGVSCDSNYKDLVIAAYEKSGFTVAYNWPYKGGRVTETYGRPREGQHAIQVELNRALYQDEETKRPNDAIFFDTQKRLANAVRYIWEHL
jgi:N-formylglutamate amidohydrolase